MPQTLALISVLLSLLVSCGDPLTPPSSDVYQRLLSTAVIHGLEIVVTYDPSSFEFTGMTRVPSGVLARAYDDGNGSVTIGLVATSAGLSGEVLRLNWDGDEASDQPTLSLAHAYAANHQPLPGVVALGDVRSLEAGGGAPAMGVSLPTSSFTGVPHADASSLHVEAFDVAASFADYHLGDVDKTDGVRVLDALKILDLVNGAIQDIDDHTAYHADVSGDDLITLEDVEMVLAKAVDPTVPAHLVVKPSRLTYLDMRADAPIIVGNGGSMPLTGLTATGENFSGTGFAMASTQPLPAQSAVYRVASDPNDANGVVTVTGSGQSASVAVGNIVFLIAGQSNASGWGQPMLPALQVSSEWPDVRALGNDYRWKPALEPLDSSAGQLDDVSRDNTVGVSPGVQLGRLLNGGSERAGVVTTDQVAPTDRSVYLIPAALSGSRLAPRNGVGWFLEEDLTGTDRATLFGSAAYRGLVSAGERAVPPEATPWEQGAEGGPVTGVFWYQGESDSEDPGHRGAFANSTASVFSAFENQFQTNAGTPVIIYAQLAPYGFDSTRETEDNALRMDLQQMDVAERQRRMEEGAYAGTAILVPTDLGLAGTPRANTHMVVTNDLPRSDRIHLSSEAQMVVAERVALAYQEHMLGLDVDGTGPRISGLSRSGAVITITFDRDVVQTAQPGPHGYSDYFTAWDGAPSPSSLISSYGTANRVDIADVRRHATNPRAIQVTLASTPSQAVHLRYMRPHENTFTSQYVEDVVRGVDSGLPLPSFGPLRVN